MGDVRNARLSLREAWRDFRWSEYRPFAWMMFAELLFLFLAVNLGSAWGMAGAGWALRSVGEPGVHYPASFLLLTSAYARFESIVLALAGSFLIPLSIARIQAPMMSASPRGADTTRRARAAYTVTLAGYLLNLAFLIGCELLLQAGPKAWLEGALGGAKGEIAAWLLGVVVALIVAAVFLYVPIRAVEDQATFADALGGGVKEGFRALLPTLLLIFAFLWPVLIVLAPLQIRPALVVTRFRPELVAVLLAIAAVLNSFVNYFIYSAAFRLHAIRRESEA